jgi:hypothetical protein
MNYLKTYLNLIRKAQNRTTKLDLYERHHVFPKSIFGKNNYTVNLSFKEHYIAHYLLYKIFVKRYGKDDCRSRKMIGALMAMNLKNSFHNRKYFNSRLYEKARTTFSESIRGENHPLYGKKHSEETRQKISRALCERSKHFPPKKLSEEHKRKLSKLRKGENNPMFGKKSPHSEETKQKISDSKKGEKNAFFGKVHSEETKQKISEKRKGFRWYNNGVKQVLTKNPPEEGFVLGMLKVPL